MLAYEGPSAIAILSIFTAQVFSGLFGGGMSSRLFQEAREQARALLFDLLLGLRGWEMRACSRFMPRRGRR